MNTAAPPWALAEDRRFVTALARGLQVLACFRSGGSLLGNHDIAERCGLPRSTVSRLSFTLTALGYLQHVPEQGKYRLGPAALALGSTMLSRLDVRQLARPLMRQLALSSGAEVALAMRDGAHMVYIEHCPSPQPIVSDLDLGARLPLAHSAIGRAWLAACRPALRAQVLQHLQSHAPCQWQQVQAMLAQWPEPGEALQPWVAHSFGDWQSHVNAIAMAFEPERDQPPMAISCGGPSRLISKDFLLHTVRPELSALVRQLQQAIRNQG